MLREHRFQSLYRDQHGTLTKHEWEKALTGILSRKDKVVMHTVILPTGFDPSKVDLANAKITEEKVYKLPPGQIPRQAQYPASIFDAVVDRNLIRPDYPIPRFVTVVSSQEEARRVAQLAKQGDVIFLKPTDYRVDPPPVTGLEGPQGSVA